MVNLLEINGSAYKVPQRFEDLSRAQYVALSRFVRAVEPRETIASHSAALLCLFRGKQKKRLLSDLEAIELDDIIQNGNRLFKTLKGMIGWAFEPVKVDVRQGVKPNIKSFRYRGTTYRLPQESLNDTVVYEWQYVDSYLRRYSQTRKIEDLLNLVATVCRKEVSRNFMKAEDFDGYYRQRFNPESIERRAKHFSKLPTYVLHAVVDYCSRCMEYLPMRYGPMFEKGSSSAKGYGWEGTVTDIAETGVFGTAIEVRYTLIHTVCRRVCQKRLQAKEHEKELKKLRK